MAFWRQGRSARFSFSGAIFAVAAGVVLFAAWNTGIYLYYISFCAIGGFLAVSLALAWWTMRGISIDRTAPEAVHRGTRFPTTVRIRNGKRLFPATLLRVESAARPGESKGFVLIIPPKREAILKIPEQFDRRGVHPLPELDIITGTPFGFFNVRRRLSDNREIVVYPRVRALRPSVLERLPKAGNLRRLTTGEGGEFFSLRQYVPGDDLRKIAWRPSARVNMLLVRELEQDASRYIGLVLDNRLNQEVQDFDERLEEAVDLVASLAVTLLNRTYSVAIVTSSDHLPLGEGPSHAGKILDMLARLKTAPASEPDPFSTAFAKEEGQSLRWMCVTPDPRMWGHVWPRSGARVLNPTEVIHA